MFLPPLENFALPSLSHSLGVDFTKLCAPSKKCALQNLPFDFTNTLNEPQTELIFAKFVCHFQNLFVIDQKASHLILSNKC